MHQSSWNANSRCRHAPSNVELSEVSMAVQSSKSCEWKQKGYQITWHFSFGDVEEGRCTEKLEFLFWPNLLLSNRDSHSWENVTLWVRDENAPPTPKLFLEKFSSAWLFSHSCDASALPLDSYTLLFWEITKASQGKNHLIPLAQVTVETTLEF